MITLILKIIRINVKNYLIDSLYKNSIFLLLTSVTVSILGFFFWILAAHFYTPQEVGLATAIISAMLLLSGFSRLGFDIGIIRFLPNEIDKKGMINSCITIIILVSFLLSSIFLLIGDFLFHELYFIKTNIAISILFIIFTIFSSLLLFQKNVFIAFRKSEYSFAQNITFSVLKLIFIIIFIPLCALGIFVSLGIATIIAMVLSLLFITPKLIKAYFPALMIDKKVVSEIFNFSFGNYIAENFSAIPTNILPILILFLLNAEMTAYYYISWSLAQLLFTIPWVIGLSLFAEGATNYEDLKKTTLKAVKFAFMIIIPILISIIFFGDKILNLFGETYSENAFTLLLILSFSSIPVALIEFYVAIERIKKRINSTILCYGGIALLTLLSSYLLVPKMGIIGAGLGWLSAQSIVAFIICLILFKDKGKEK